MDISVSRLERLNRTLKEFLPEEEIQKIVETGLNIEQNPYYNSEQYFHKVQKYTQIN
jgi:hypothetical protein